MLKGRGDGMVVRQRGGGGSTENIVRERLEILNLQGVERTYDQEMYKWSEEMPTTISSIRGLNKW